MTTPRTVAGQAAISAMRPYVRRALARTIIAIEDEAIAPYVEALREADRVLEALVAEGDEGLPGDGRARAELVQRAAAARRQSAPLLAPPAADER